MGPLDEIRRSNLEHGSRHDNCYLESNSRLNRARVGRRVTVNYEYLPVHFPRPCLFPLHTHPE
jgi:hypothetical protein